MFDVLSYLLDLCDLEKQRRGERGSFKVIIWDKL